MSHNLIDILLILFGTGSIIIGMTMIYRADKKIKDWRLFQPTYKMESYGVETLAMSFLTRSMDGIKMLGGPPMEENSHTCIDEKHFDWIKRDYAVKLAKKMMEDGFVKTEVEEIGCDKRVTMQVKLLRLKN